ncbi:unnamed protein product, partial [Polarella glacialis]
AETSQATSDEPDRLVVELRSRAAALRAELQAVEAASAAAGAEQPQLLHHRPSWSLLGGAEGAEEVLRELGTQDQDFEAVLQDHAELQVGPIGSYNHWDRRECAVGNPEEWRARCAKYMKDISGSADIPKVIHQIWVGPKEPPCLWIDTFRIDYLEANPDWKFELWSDDQVATLPMFNEKIYTEEKLWQCKADVLRLEFLWHHGGVYVDADMISVGNKSLNSIIELGKETGFVIAYEPDTKDKPYSILGNSVIACTPHHPLILMLILFLKQTYHQKRHVVDVFAVTGPVMYTKCLVDCNMPISIADQQLLYPAFHFVPNPDAIDFSRFPDCLMFQFGYTCSGLEGYVKRRNRCRKPRSCPFHAKTTLMSSYRQIPTASEAELYGQVPVGISYLQDLLESPPGASDILLDNGIGVFVTNGELVQMEGLRRDLPGFVDGLRSQIWDVMLFGAEWSTGSDEVVLFNVPPGGRPRNAMVCGLVMNAGGSRDFELVRSVLSSCITEKGFDPSSVFDAADRLSVWFGAQKFEGTLAEARIWKSILALFRLTCLLAGHDPPLNFDRHEVHGNIVKGWLDGRLAFEMVSESNGGIMFRSWNDDNSPNCEMKSNGSRVEWMKVFYNHQVVFEGQDKPLP